MAKKADQREKLGETLETGQHRKRKRKGMCLEDRPVLVPNAGGIDIGAREIYVAVPPDRDQDPVQPVAARTVVANEEDEARPPKKERTPLVALPKPLAQE